MEKKSLWQAVLGELEITLSKASFTTWFKNTFIHSFEKGIVVIGVPDLFHKEWLEHKFHHQIQKILSKVSQKEIKKVEYKVINQSVILPKPAVKQVVSFSDKKIKKIKTELNPNYSFENFVVGPSNRLAYAAAKAVAQSPGTVYNPLFIYGGAGLGKTHLMQAIGSEIVKNSDKKVLYATCEKFTNEFVQAVQNSTINLFKEKYRNIDVLLIDDIQFLMGKDSTKEEFFHTFNALYQNNKQIVISSDRPPKALSSLEERLISRFEGGMLADILPPDLETRVAILNQKAKEKNYVLDQEIIEFIATKVQHNIRELEGALTRLVATCQLSGEPPTLEKATQILDNFSSGSKTRITIKKIIKEVSDFYGLKEEDILCKKRDKTLVHPRQVVMYLIRHELNFSFPKIGQELQRDHTTVIHGCEKIEKQIVQNHSLKQEISLIKTRLYGE